MSASEYYSQLLSDISRDLKPLGFRKNGANFRLNYDRNWGIVNFQKSTKSTSQRVIFTVNLGTYSGFVGSFLAHSYDPVQRGGFPNISDCHWRMRIGSALPKNGDKWWEIDEVVRLESLVAEMHSAILNHGVPAINSHLADDQLLSGWLRGEGGGQSKLQVLLMTSVLLKKEGRDEELRRVLNQIRSVSEGKPTAFTAEQHMRKLDIYRFD